MLMDGPTDDELEEARAGMGMRAPRLHVVTNASPADDWRAQLKYEHIKGGRDRIVNHVANAICILRHHPEWTWPDGTSRLHLDEHQQNIYVTQPPWDKIDEPAVVYEHPVPWRDADDTRLSSWFLRSSFGLKIDKNHCQDAVCVVADSNRINPWRDYLDARVWDGVPRLKHALADFFGVAPGPYASAVFRWWLTSAVARTYEPGCKADLVWILEGEQGLKKSTALRILAVKEDYFADTPIAIGDKDAYIALLGKVIYEVAEFRVDTKQSKAFWSSPVDNFRPPYGRRNQAIPRRCVFAATINPKGEYLNDPTGGRRYLPTLCTEIFLDGLAAATEQLWAEAVSVYKGAFSCAACEYAKMPRHRCAEHRWWPETPEEHALCGVQQEHRTHVDAWEELIETWCALPSNRDEVSVSGVMTGALGMDKDRITGRAQERVAVILAALGYERQGRENGERRVVYRRKSGTI
jgi:putative DNA primase/helicase